MNARGGLRLIALFEGLKGALVLAAGFGALSLLHHDVERLAESLIQHLHLNPAGRYPHIFLEAAARVDDARLLGLAALAAAYAAVRLAEGFGLWRDKAWAEWLGAASGALYVPLELEHLWRRPTFTRVTLLVMNVAIVAFLLQRLAARRR